MASARCPSPSYDCFWPRVHVSSLGLLVPASLGLWASFLVALISLPGDLAQLLVSEKAESSLRCCPEWTGKCLWKERMALECFTGGLPEATECSV